ncbi:hypothetical protein ACHWQZ_G009732 [Mnemiopsis leidyi]
MPVVYKKSYTAHEAISLMESICISDQESISNSEDSDDETAVQRNAFIVPQPPLERPEAITDEDYEDTGPKEHSHYADALLKQKKNLMRVKAEDQQNKLIESQRQVISAQAELSECKSEQLEMLRKTVETSVIDSVKTVETTLVDSMKTELKSYSSAVQMSRPIKEQAFSTEVLKKVVRNVIEEEDRSRNVVIFGLTEEDNEDMNQKVAEVYESIVQKPRADACRVGIKKSKDLVHPVKVKLSSSLIVDEILTKVKNLRNITRFSSVFMCPDCSLEQRKIQKELVKDLQDKAKAEPDKHFYIRAGEIQWRARAML